jgi:chaperonin GroEL
LTEDIEAAIAADVGDGRAMSVSAEPDEDWSDLPRFELDDNQCWELLSRIARRAHLDGDVMTAVWSALRHVGDDGGMLIEQGLSMSCETEVDWGLHLFRGHLSPHLVADEKSRETVLEQARIFICKDELTDAEGIAELATRARRGNRSLLIIADKVGDDVLAEIVRRRRDGESVAAILAPGFGDRNRAILEDVAIFTGGSVSTLSGYVAATTLLAHLRREGLIDFREPGSLSRTRILGQAQKVIIRDDETILLGGAGEPDAVRAREEEIRAAIEGAESQYDRLKLRERLHSFSIATIRVGASSVDAMPGKIAQIKYLLAAVRQWIQDGTIAPLFKT